MSRGELTWLDATAQAELVAKGAVTPAELDRRARRFRRMDVIPEPRHGPAVVRGCTRDRTVSKVDKWLDSVHP